MLGHTLLCQCSGLIRTNTRVSLTKAREPLMKFKSKVQMCWKCQNMSAIAWYMTFFNQRWRFPCFFRLDAPELGSRSIEAVNLLMKFKHKRLLDQSSRTIAYEVQMCWKCQNMSAIAWYLTFFNQRWRFPSFFFLSFSFRLENLWRCKPAYEVQMCWKCQNMSIIAQCWFFWVFLTFCLPGFASSR